MEQSTTEGQESKRPTVREAVLAVLRELPDDGRQLESLTIRGLASGEVPFRMHFAGEVDSEGGVAVVENAAINQ